ncbi:CarD family transcriptional regulator [Ruminococcus bromii]|jgi:CarD family transcriptional regulator|nr:CarD family transcriptional regulator [Ruminococcus bromii]
MYSIGEIVLYGSNGVCEITEITTKKIGKDSIEYYVLKPVCSDSSTLFVPTQNEMLVSRMRVVLSSDEIKDILSQKTDNEIWIDNKAERCEKIKEIISGGDCMKLVELIRRMHFHSKLQLKKCRRLHITDERFLKEAEKMVCDEVSVVLHIDRNDVLPLVLAG